MFEIMVTVAFIWLSLKMLGLVFSLTWGAAKVVASLLFVLACPLLLVGLLFAGGLLLLVPLLMVGAALGIVRNG